MAIGASTVWRVRISGNDTNGAGFDSTIASAGTDYSQQDSPQLSVTDAVGNGTTTLTSATGGFTSAMIGNSIRISAGTGATTGYYFITARTDTNTVTIDRSPGTGTGWTAKVGGAAATWQRVATTGSATGDKAVPGNTVYIRGAGSDSPSSADYTFTGFTQPPDGNATAGRIKFIGENGRPRLQGNGLIFYNFAYIWLENLYLTCSSNSNGTFGLANPLGNNVIRDCVFNTNNQTATVGIHCTAGGTTEIVDNEIFGNTSSPTSSSGCHGIQVGAGSYGVRIMGNFIHHCRDVGIMEVTSSLAAITAFRNVLYANVGDQMSLSCASTTGGVIAENVIDAGSGHGINITVTAALAFRSIFNNIISNHVGGSKYGINIGAGTSAVNDKVKGFFDYNCLYNNTGSYNAISAGANDQSVDPQYTNAAAYDWSIGTNLKALGWPVLIKKTTTTWYVDIGTQREEAGGGGGGLVAPIISGMGGLIIR